jgi:hypothetical protein
MRRRGMRVGLVSRSRDLRRGFHRASFCHPGRNGSIGGSLVKKKPLFEKSGAKTFLNLGHGLWRDQRPWPRFKKVFLLLFLQKKKRLLLLPRHGRLQPGDIEQ